MNFSPKKLLYLFILFLFLILIKTAWVSDDAYLTIRSVDNFVNGYGLRWNILERVQIYTHPLWMFLLSATYYFIRNPMITFYTQTILVSLIAIYVFGVNFTKSYINIFFGFSILYFSKAFIDFSTSGLENPLSHLLIILFLVVFFKQEDFSLKEIFILFFIASLVAFNRMDTFVILLPSLLYVLYKKRNIQSILYAFIGFLPFIFWEIFSLIYYGFPFPNTAYAKLATGIEKTLLIQQGYRYFYDSLLRDPITLIVIFTAVLSVFISKKTKDIFIAVGILIYLVYLVQIGGDYMSGRFFSVLIIIAVILLIRLGLFNDFSSSRKYYILFISLVFFRFYLLNTYSPFIGNVNIIHDDRKLSVSTSLVNINLDTFLPDNDWVRKGLAHKEKGIKLTVQDTAGMLAFYTGPNVHIVDRYALGDPLLARLPAIEQDEVLIGHFYRSVPAGYWRFNRSYGNEIEDENLKKYYEKLSIIIHDENLFSLERITMIWRMNTGYYDHLIDSYLKNIKSP